MAKKTSKVDTYIGEIILLAFARHALLTRDFLCVIRCLHMAFLNKYHFMYFFLGIPLIIASKREKMFGKQKKYQLVCLCIYAELMREFRK